MVAIDLRGSGGSSIPRDGYDKKTMAGDVRAVVRQLGLGPVALVGNDHGGGVAYAYAAQHPREVTHLAVIEYWMAGFGYEQFLTAKPEWNSATNWQLVLFTLPDVAEWLCRGRERELLAWFSGTRRQTRTRSAVRILRPTSAITAGPAPCGPASNTTRLSGKTWRTTRPFLERSSACPFWGSAAPQVVRSTWLTRSRRSPNASERPSFRTLVTG